MPLDKIARLGGIYLVLSSFAAQAQTGSIDQLLDLSLEDLLNIQVQVGSRTGQNRLGNHNIAVDVITAEELTRTGYNQLPKVLNHLLPSFTYDFATVDDLTDHARPFSLNGLKADQVLVLINGKRLHQGSIIDANDSQNRGSAAVDLSLIPLQAISRVEVLRDDASAQYGSDAIAGVINIVLKGGSEDLRKPTAELVVSTGRSAAGDGETLLSSYSRSTANSFFTLEYQSKQASNTSGLDRRDYYFAGDPRNGDYKITHRYGDPEMHSLALTFNTRDFWHSPGSYALGKVVYKDSEATGFFRTAKDDRNLRAIYPDGYLPALAPKQWDLFGTLGYRSERNGYSYDLSNTFGYNKVAIAVENSVNASLGTESPTQFDAGSLNFWQNSLNLDITKSLTFADSKPINLAWGGEYRHEGHRIGAGETASWIDGLVPVLDGSNAGADTVAGAQLYPGFAPDNANSLSRDLAAVYAEAQRELLDQLSATVSLRDEHYSDFGNTLNGKILLHYQASPKLDLRGSLSSGYRAPSLQQMGYYRTATGFNAQPNGRIVGAENGTFPVDHAVARLLGAQDLKPEKSIRTNLGLTWQPSAAVQLALDYFHIDIRERIFLSGEISNSPLIPVAAQEYMSQQGIALARYFLNGVDTRSRGFDGSVSYTTSAFAQPLQLKLQLHHQQSRLENQHFPSALSLLKAQVFDRNEQERLLHYIPENKAIFSLDYQIQTLRLSARANYFGKVIYVSDSDDPSSDQWFGAKVIFDTDISYQYSSALNLALGGHNMFNTRPDYRNPGAPYNGAGNIFQYRGISPFDYTGAFYYLRAKFSF